MKILVLDNRSQTLDSLLGSLEALGVTVKVKPPGSAVNALESYGGLVISGGALPSESYREALTWYGELLHSTVKPILAVCLGLRIMGYCYGARVRRRVNPEKGVVKIIFHQEYPLAKGKRALKVYQDHSYDLLYLPTVFRNYASSPTCQIQAVKHTTKPLFGVQFHPEVSDGNDGSVILKSFVELCTSSQSKFHRRVTSQP